ncbi:MAG: aminofutalosine synthase MqnE [Marinilabiliales bacterium]|nr:MAG: aminofutalosine synthase MqnE [Marinilabiliales bacterium]
MNNLFSQLNKTELQIYDKIQAKQAISIDDGIYLAKNSSLAFCAFLANSIRERLYAKKAFLNVNTHIEISNRCVNKCKFCSFYRKKGDPDCWDLEIDDVLRFLESKSEENLTEVHLTGGLHTEKTSQFYCDLFTEIKKQFPQIHIKAFTAVEIEYFAKSDGLTTEEAISKLKTHGLNSLAGGGAEILDDKIRRKICPEKTNSETWLKVHKIAHQTGLSSNCTMLYGHIESVEDRIYHMAKLRELQEETNGFNCFIQLKYKTYGNRLNIHTEINLPEELKTYAIARIFLHNIPHIKAYWPMTGIENAALAMSYGADDMDGTISDSTKIYSMAGSIEQKPQISKAEMEELISLHGFVPVERDSLYYEVH